MSEENSEKTGEETKEKTGFQLYPENINKKGRPPKGHSITEIIKEMMDEKPEIKRALGGRIIKLALAGDLTAIKAIWAYLDGLPIQRTELEVTEKPTPILPDDPQDVSTNNSEQENPTPNETD